MTKSIHGECAKYELVPALGPQVRRRQTRVPKCFKRERMHVAFRMTACAVGAELASPRRSQINLRENRARRVAGAEEENVVHRGYEAQHTEAAAGVL